MEGLGLPVLTARSSFLGQTELPLLHSGGHSSDPDASYHDLPVCHGLHQQGAALQVQGLRKDPLKRQSDEVQLAHGQKARRADREVDMVKDLKESDAHRVAHLF